MLIDLRNTEYYLSKNFSIKDKINNLFQSSREDLTEEEKEKISNLNKTTALSTLPTALGIGSLLLGRKMKKFRENQIKEGSNKVPIADGHHTRRLGYILSGIGLAGGVTSQLLKNRVYKKKDREEEDAGVKTFAIPGINRQVAKRPMTMPKAKNAAQQTQAQMTQQRAAQTQQKMQQQNQLESARAARASQVQGRHNQNYMQRQMLEAGRNNRAQMMKSSRDQSNIIQSRRLATAQQKNQVNSNIANPKVGPKPIVSVN